MRVDLGGLHSAAVEVLGSSLPCLSPDRDEFRRPASTPAKQVVHPNQPELLANRLFGVRRRGVSGYLWFEFDSHALPPPTSRNFYCWGASVAPVSSLSPSFSAGAWALDRRLACRRRLVHVPLRRAQVLARTRAPSPNHRRGSAACFTRAQGAASRDTLGRDHRMRHKVVHDYMGVDEDVVWRTARRRCLGSAVFSHPWSVA